MNTNDELRAIELTGGCAASLGEALDQRENERQALAELFDENQAFELSFRHFDVAVTLIERTLAQIETEAGLWLSPKTRDKIALFREQCQKMEYHRTLAREFVLNARQRPLKKAEVLEQNTATPEWSCEQDSVVTAL